MAREVAFCAVCQNRFLYEPMSHDGKPRCCGRPRCRAMEHYSPAEWEGRARMARARLAAGRRLVSDRGDATSDRPYVRTFKWSTTELLDDVDREALARAGSPAGR